MSNVLIVDDDPDLRECVRDIFLARGYDVFEASNGHEAFDVLVTVTPDLILTDIDMPRMNGVKFLKKFHLVNNRTPVIVVSGGGKFSSEYILSLGATIFLQKPFNNIELLFQVLAV